MSFWPKLRRRSRGRKRSTAKPNPYASIGLDKLAIVHAEFDAQRALFAAEKGVPISVVRFVSGSPRGWALLPHSAVSPSPQEEEEEEYNRSSTTPTPPASSVTGSVQAQAQEVPRPRPQRTSSRRNLLGEAQPTNSTPIPDLRCSEKAEAPCSSSSATASATTTTTTTTLNAGSISNFTELKIKSSQIEGQAGGAGGGVSGKDLVWNNKLTQTASVLLLSLGVFTTVLGSCNLSTLILRSWNQGKSSFKRVFSILATHLISAIRPSLQLKLSSSSSSSGGGVVVVSVNSISSSPSSDLEAEMKVTSLTPISASVPSKEIDTDSRSSSFAFPVLSRDSSVGTPIFRVQQDLSTSQGQHQHGQAIVAAATALRPVVTSVKVVAVTAAQPGSPAFDGSKGCQKPCQKLKARIFKCHPPRKVTPATSENSSAEEDVTDSGADVETSNQTQTQGETDSPRVTDSPTRSTDSPRCRRLSFIKRRSKNSKGGTTESDDHLSGLSGSIGRESELEEVSSPVTTTRVVTVKASKSSSEVLTSRNPNSGDSLTSVKKLSRSQELKLSFKNLKKKYKSQELCPVAANEQEYRQLELESAATAAVKGLEELAFPFNHEADSSNCSTPTTPRFKPEKRKSCLIRMKSGDCDKLGEGNVSSSPRSNTTTTTTTAIATTSRLSRSVASKMPAEKNTIMNCKPELRKVRPVLTRVPLPVEHGGGDLGRTSSFMDRETLGALLVLAVLVFLLLGKIPAIFGTAGVCLLLSHVRKYLSYNMCPRERERLGFKSATGGGVVGSSRLGGTSPPHSNNNNNNIQTNPALDVQSSEYRKKVLIEGFLDRGNRRTG